LKIHLTEWTHWYEERNKNTCLQELQTYSLMMSSEKEKKKQKRGEKRKQKWMKKFNKLVQVIAQPDSQPRFGKNIDELYEINDGKLPILNAEVVQRALSSSAIDACPSLGSWRITSFPTSFDREDYTSGVVDGLKLEDICFRRDLEELYFYQEGENDIAPWILIGKLKVKGKTYYFHFNASCDFTSGSSPLEKLHPRGTCQSTETLPFHFLEIVILPRCSKRAD
jgi:hypothetical protein